MVTHISASGTPAPPPPRGVGMLRTPYVATVVVLALVAAVVWGVVLAGQDAATDAVACPAPPQGAPSRIEPQTADALDGVPAARLSETRFRVLNANGQSGQAGAVAAQLGELGFTSAGENAVGNDTVFTGQDLACHGQIRYGESGQSQARSLSVAAPCMELVRDGRADAAVDLVLGQTFAQLTKSNTALGVLDRLQSGTTPAPEQIDAARSVDC